ncbi:MAG: hypothetical protein AAFU03_10425, partial [Bacteroidota bacterium]
LKGPGIPGVSEGGLGPGSFSTPEDDAAALAAICADNPNSAACQAIDEIVVRGTRTSNDDSNYLNGLRVLDLTGGLIGNDAQYAYLGPNGPIIVGTRKTRSDYEARYYNPYYSTLAHDRARNQCFSSIAIANLAGLAAVHPKTPKRGKQFFGTIAITSIVAGVIPNCALVGHDF